MLLNGNFDIEFKDFKPRLKKKIFDIKFFTEL